MREYFKDLFVNLYILTGVQQYARFQEMTNGEEMFRRLIDDLVKTCNRFLLPDDRKKHYIEKALNSKEFRNINVAWLFNVLVEPATKYEEERRSAERQKQIIEADKKAAPPEVAVKYIEQIRKQAQKIGKHYETDPVVFADEMEAREAYKKLDTDVSFEAFMDYNGYKYDGESWYKYKGAGSRLKEKLNQK